jgi:DinB superfamily
VTRSADLLRDTLARSIDVTRWTLEGLTDDECFWEPVQPCWSVRRRAEAGPGWGIGGWVCEDEWPQPEPLPVTSIAWRIAHLAAWTEVYRNWTFEDKTASLLQFEVPSDGEGLTTWLEGAQRSLQAAVGPLDDEAIGEPRPAHYGPHLPIAQLVMGMSVEYTHHVAEIGLLRDLRRGFARVQPPPVKEEP